jgi:hypothetical protein
MAAVQGPAEVGQVDDVASRGVHNYDARLHHFESILGDEVVRQLGQRAMQG